jgi:predicted RNase H-like HicB family nuclease
VRYCYPATFFPHENGSGAYGVIFADLPGCVSVGDDLPHAVEMAHEALGLHLSGMLEDGDALPRPSSLESALESSRSEAAEAGDCATEGMFCQYVVVEPYPLKVPEPPVRLSISLRNDIVKKIDVLAEEMGLTRSGLINVAARDYINRMQQG